MINSVTLIGNVGMIIKNKSSEKEGKVKTFKFTLATTESWKDDDGEWVNKTTWHNCVVFGKFAESLKKRVKKGVQLYLEGKIDNTSSEDDDGNKKYFSSIIVNTVRVLTKAEDSEEKPSEINASA